MWTDKILLASQEKNQVLGKQEMRLALGFSAVTLEGQCLQNSSGKASKMAQ